MQPKLITFIIGKEPSFIDGYNPCFDTYYLMVQFLHQTKYINELSYNNIVVNVYIYNEIVACMT